MRSQEDILREAIAKNCPQDNVESMLWRVNPEHSWMGWIDTRGRFWGCGHATHAKLAECLGYEEYALEDSGWIKLTMSGTYARRRVAFSVQWDKLAEILDIKWGVMVGHDGSDLAEEMAGNELMKFYMANKEMAPIGKIVDPR